MVQQVPCLLASKFKNLCSIPGTYTVKGENWFWETFSWPPHVHMHTCTPHAHTHTHSTHTQTYAHIHTSCLKLFLWSLIPFLTYQSLKGGQVHWTHWKFCTINIFWAVFLEAAMLEMKGPTYVSPELDISHSCTSSCVASDESFNLCGLHFTIWN